MLRIVGEWKTKQDILSNSNQFQWANLGTFLGFFLGGADSPLLTPFLVC